MQAVGRFVEAVDGSTSASLSLGFQVIMGQQF